jgi:hypothetical protein
VNARPGHRLASAGFDGRGGARAPDRRRGRVGKLRLARSDDAGLGSPRGERIICPTGRCAVPKQVAGDIIPGECLDDLLGPPCLRKYRPAELLPIWTCVLSMASSIHAGAAKATYIQVDTHISARYNFLCTGRLRSMFGGRLRSLAPPLLAMRVLRSVGPRASARLTARRSAGPGRAVPVLPDAMMTMGTTC